MTDAAIPVTERAVERFVETYLSSLGATIQTDANQWRVSVPDSATTNLEFDDTTLIVASDPNEVEDSALTIAPESEFVEGLLDEAAERTPAGSLALTGEELGVRLPTWLTAGPIEVIEQSFTPYYDRRALCTLFHIGIETVSEYQTEELRAVAIDLNGDEKRPRLGETYLELAGSEDGQQLSMGPQIDRSTLEETLLSARRALEREIEPDIQELRERATRAAAVELDEYRQYVQQRYTELDEHTERLTERLAAANETIDDAADQSERIEALRKRKELQTQRAEVRSERAELRDLIEADFSEKRREVYDRHALTVRLRPVTLTAISYERGDLALSLQGNNETTSITVAYAVGIGVLDEQRCERCDEPLTEDNPLTLDGELLVGSGCCR
jgi:hypothetical protein